MALCLASMRLCLVGHHQPRYFSSTSFRREAARVISKVKDFRELRKEWHKAGKTVGFVPTMGCLHQGHLALVKLAQKQCDHVVVSIFVNPAQFAPHEDFGAYPRMLERDVDLLKSIGTDVVLTPSVDEMYPAGISLKREEQRGTFVEVLGMSHQMEGIPRPHFFRGVATVVTKLFNIAQPDVAVFGQKDAQQCVVVRNMARDLLLPIKIVIGKTEREQDGLALSSRNRYLSPEERKIAPTLYFGLCAAKELYDQGERNRTKLIDAAGEKILNVPGVQFEYLSLADSETLQELDVIQQGRGVILSGAIRVGKTRLIDNFMF